nr:hypothetical protein [uncultured Bifidobacterium sp.]
MNSPHYLYGESYGTMRNAVVYRMLGEHGVGVAGVTEQSTILDYEPTLSGEDAYYPGMFPVYAATANYFKKAGVGVDQYENYEGLSLKVNSSWNRTHQAPGTMGSDQVPNVAYDLATALRRNPTSRICVLGGIHDAATPYWNVRHDINKLFLPQALKDRIEYHLHSNGHMLYCDGVALAAAGPELKAFYDKRHEDQAAQ